MRQVGDVVQRVVVEDHGLLFVGQLSVVNQNRLAAVFWVKGCLDGTWADDGVLGAVLAADSVPFEEDWAGVAELEPFNVDRVTRDRDACSVVYYSNACVCVC